MKKESNSEENLFIVVATVPIYQAFRNPHVNTSKNSNKKLEKSVQRKRKTNAGEICQNAAEQRIKRRE